jgi:hypothetical protein
MRSPIISTAVGAAIDIGIDVDMGIAVVAIVSSRKIINIIIYFCLACIRTGRFAGTSIGLIITTPQLCGGTVIDFIVL